MVFAFEFGTHSLVIVNGRGELHLYDWQCYKMRTIRQAQNVGTRMNTAPIIQQASQVTVGKDSLCPKSLKARKLDGVFWNNDIVGSTALFPMGVNRSWCVS
jgi:hypothetical protein